MNTYAEKKRAVLPHEQGADLRQKSIAPQLNALQNIDVHSGHSLRLEEGLKSRIEQHLGYDLSGVELRESADAADIGAEAFAKGNVVHFAPGQFDQHTERGQHLIAHELSHVVQQAKGGVHADVEGFNVNSSAALEGAADHAGDSFVSGGHASLSAPLSSLPAMNADAAPIQGSFFGKIKDFFKKQKASFDFGRAARKKDKVVRGINAEHASDEEQMVKTMKEQGFTDEMIEAQKMFQRVNMSQSRGMRYQESQVGMMDAASSFTDPAMMNNFAARLGRGALTKSRQNSLAAEQDNMLNNVLAGNAESAQAEEMGRNISEKLRKQQAAGAVMDQIAQDRDVKDTAFTGTLARYNQRHGTNVNRDSGNVHAIRYLARHLNGLDDGEADKVMDDMLSGDKTKMAPYIKKEIDRFMQNADMNAIGDSASDDEVINGALPQILLSQDNMAIADSVKGGFDAETLGVSPEYIEQYMEKKKRHAVKYGTASARLRRMKDPTISW